MKNKRQTYTKDEKTKRANITKIRDQQWKRKRRKKKERKRKLKVKVTEHERG